MQSYMEARGFFFSTPEGELRGGSVKKGGRSKRHRGTLAPPPPGAEKSSSSCLIRKSGVPGRSNL